MPLASLSLALLVSRAAVCSGAMAVSGARRRLPANAPGNFFVDSSCIDCDTCRWMAPHIFGREHSKSFVHTQPQSGAERVEAAAAAVACPVGSIRTEQAIKEAVVARDSFPKPIDEEMLPNVYHLGWHSPSSFGATPYLLSCELPPSEPSGCETHSFNVMVDSPRFHSRLAKELEARGGVHLMLLTHKDDVSDHNKWKERFPSMQRIMHSADVRGSDRWPYIDMTAIEHQLSGPGPWDISQLPGVIGRGLPAGLLSAIHTPGHSAGSLSFLAREPLVRPVASVDTTTEAVIDGEGGVLFSGDHFCFSARLGRLDGMGRYGDDLKEQARSIAKLADEPFLHLLPGHSRRYVFESADDRRRSIDKAARDFAEDPLGSRVF